MDAGRTTLELVISLAKNGSPKRVPVSRILSTIGSAGEADIRLPGLPSRWGMLQRKGDEVTLHLESGAEHHLEPGQPLAVDGLVVTIQAARDHTAPWPVEELAEELVAVDAPAAALERLLEFVLLHTGAGVGAILLEDQGSYGVAATAHAAGQTSLDAASLLSDTVVMDVLGGTGAVLIRDASSDAHYGQVPSVLRRGLNAVVCLPLMVGSRILGALYLADNRAHASFDEGTVRSLRVLCGMAGPYIIQLRRAAAAPAVALDGPIGDCPAMIELRELVAKVGATDITVLLSGETGTGKEVTARSLHRASRRAQGPFIAVNCSSVPESLMEAELFGCKKGAFTGATADRVGLIEAANGGTLFLDEIGDMPPSMQIALLRVIQERELTRVGETAPRQVDFRLVAASHRDLEAEAAAGRFRADLMFRIAEVTLRLPRLAERGEDIALLARLFLHQAVRELGIPARTLTHAAEEALAVHDWPGNVRELRAAMRRAAVLANGIEIDAPDLHLGGRPKAAVLAPEHTNGAPPAVAPMSSGESVSFAPLDLPLADARARFACVYAQAVLARVGGDREAAARSLDISLRSLYRYLQ